MLINSRALLLAFALVVPAAMAADGNLRGENPAALVVHDGQRKLESENIDVYYDFASWKAALDALTKPKKKPVEDSTCAYCVERFDSGTCPVPRPPPGADPIFGCGFGNNQGTGNYYLEQLNPHASCEGVLTWQTFFEVPFPIDNDKDTRVEDGLFKDRLRDRFFFPDDKTYFSYPDLEAWGATFDLGPDGLGTGIEIEVYADGEKCDTVMITTTAPVFRGYIAKKPITYIEIQNGSRFTPTFTPRETYTVDDFYIFPWCSPLRGGVKGDPHVQTWLGNYFDFMGQCDVVFLQDKAHDIDIHARTTIRYDYSYIETAAVRIGEDILEVSSYGQHALNGVDSALSPSGVGYTVGGYPLYYTNKNKRSHKFDIVIGSEKNITVGVFKDLVSILANGDNDVKYFEHSTGIMGSVHGQLIGRDGKTEFDIKDQKEMDAFGQEWQVGPEDPKLFRTDRAPQYPAKCDFPSEEVKEARRLSQSPIELNAAERACARFAGATYEKCVYDVMAFGDLEVADAGIY